MEDHCYDRFHNNHCQHSDKTLPIKSEEVYILSKQLGDLKETRYAEVAKTILLDKHLFQPKLTILRLMS